MKKINIIFAILCMAVFSSCEDFLDKKPSNSGDAATSIQTAADAQVIVNGIMSKLTSANYLGRNMFLYGDAKGGDLTIVSQGRGQDALYTFNHSASSNTYSGFWTTGYNIILQLNNLLENIERIKAGGSIEKFDEIEGQALTLRGMLYFDLVRLYGKPYNYQKDTYGVPDIITVLDASDRKLRATVAQNYEQILKDLTTAENLLVKDRSKGGYIGYYGNKALQARVYLAMENFDDAFTCAEVIIKSKKYTLYKNEEWVASWGTQNGSESIFELAMLDNEGDLGTSSLGAYYSRAKHYSDNIWGYFVASDYWLERMGEDPNDVRWGIMNVDEMSKSIDPKYSEERYGACYKYLGGIDMKGDGKSAGSAVNVKVIRLSEIYLIASEAALRKSQPDKTAAKNYLNEIRKRAPGLALATESTISLDMILSEKSKEFFGEGQRFFDLIRCNKTITFDDDTPGITPPQRAKTIDRTFEKAILPIFQSEINANPAIEKQQNPGY